MHIPQPSSVASVQPHTCGNLISEEAEARLDADIRGYEAMPHKELALAYALAVKHAVDLQRQLDAERRLAGRRIA